MTALLLATRNAHKAREIQQVLARDYQYFTLLDFPAAPDAVEDGATFAANAAKKASILADWLAANCPSSTLPKSDSLNLNPNLNPNLIPSPREAGRARLRRAVELPAPDEAGLGAVASSLRLDSIPSPREAGRGPGRGVPSTSAFYILADDSGLEVDALGGAPGVLSARFAALDGGGADNSPDSANNAKLLRLLKDVPMARRTARFRCVLALRRLFVPSAAETLLFEGVCAGRISLHPAGGGGFGYDPLFVPAGHTHSFAELGETVKNTLSHRARALQRLRQYLTST